MSEYFNGLMRMTGISFGRGENSQRPKGTGIDAPQPLHLEETHVVEAPTPAEDKLTVPSPGSAPGVEPITRSAPRIPYRVDVKDQPGTSQDNTGTAMSVETGPGSPGTSPLEKEHTRTLTVSRAAGTRTSLPDTPQPAERLETRYRQPGNGYGQVNVIEEEKEVKDPVGAMTAESFAGITVKSGQSEIEPVAGTIVEIVPDYKGRKERIAVDKETTTFPRNESGLAVEDVLRWVAEPPLEVEAAVKDNVASQPPKTKVSQAVPLQENREFSLSIGTISITVEEPQTGTDFLKDPPPPLPLKNGQVRNTAGETPTSRLGRYYLRMRG